MGTIRANFATRATTATGREEAGRSADGWGSRVLVRIDDRQGVEARIVIDEGEYVLAVRPGLLSSRAFVALNVALAPLAPKREQYVQGAR